MLLATGIGLRVEVRLDAEYYCSPDIVAPELLQLRFVKFLVHTAFLSLNPEHHASALIVQRAYYTAATCGSPQQRRYP